jgi:hypothetical protein
MVQMAGSITKVGTKFRVTLDYGMFKGYIPPGTFDRWSFSCGSKLRQFIFHIPNINVPTKIR